jgi:chromosome segregation ATPase
MTAILDRLSLALEQTDNANGLLADAADEIRRLEFELNRLDHERKLALDHDRQPYPSAAAYEKACSEIEVQRQRADRAEARLRESESLAEFMTDSLSEIKKVNQQLTATIETARELLNEAGQQQSALDAAVVSALLDIIDPAPEKT